MRAHTPCRWASVRLSHPQGGSAPLQSGRCTSGPTRLLSRAGDRVRRTSSSAASEGSGAGERPFPEGGCSSQPRDTAAQETCCSLIPTDAHSLMTPGPGRHGHRAAWAQGSRSAWEKQSLESQGLQFKSQPCHFARFATGHVSEHVLCLASSAPTPGGGGGDERGPCGSRMSMIKPRAAAALYGGSEQDVPVHVMLPPDQDPRRPSGSVQP